jgi:pimeloyl-ACP methyl ester carboxylesterase
MSNFSLILSSTASYILTDFWCKLTHSFRPKAPTIPDYQEIYTSPNYQMQTYGACNDGSYIEVYQPQNPFLGENGKPKVVIYLHGFDLGASEIYGSHLVHLVKQGYYVFYPNFQTGFCSFPASEWQTIEQLIDETIGDGLIAQKDWINNALKSVSTAYGTVGFTDTTALDTYVFGHSLGGLFALSWPYFVQQENYPENMMPLQILVADPIPDTAAPQFPGRLGQIIEKFTDVIDVKVTGAALTMPVAILHGNDDWVVPKDSWKEKFPYIKTNQKKMFLSFTDQRGCPAMYSNHEQATVNTSFFPPLLALTVLDGVGTEDDLNWRYIWYGLDRVIRYGDRADQLQFDMGTWSDGEPVKPIQVFLSGTPDS